MKLRIVAPWKPILRNQQEFSLELSGEVGPGHPLFGKQVQALARPFDNDDVLFAILETKQYAVVHLTWSGKQEPHSLFPGTFIFSTLNEWVTECMTKDHNNV